MKKILPSVFLLTSLVSPAAGDVPVVVVTYPAGGETIASEQTVVVTYTASDSNGVSQVDVHLSDDGGFTYRPVALARPASGSYSWFVPNLPGAQNRIRITARDPQGNSGSGASPGNFSILAATGRLPTTLRDMELPGSQPLTGVTLVNPDLSCVFCHGDYDADHEPWRNWRGSMMGQAARDPLFYACLAIAEQDAPSVGDLCIRCHSPGGWLEGRSVDTSGGLLTAKDRQGVQCDFCHRLVDYEYVEGVSPPADTTVLAAIFPLPLQHGNGQYVVDPALIRRGPFADAAAPHTFIESPFHRDADLCGTCHDVSNPVFERTGPHDYEPGAFDVPHTSADRLDMFPIERTYSEWSNSEYAATGVFAPQFAGNKPDGIVSTCQDCHLPDALAQGCGDEAAPLRPDMPVHDLMGANTFIPDILDDFWPSEVDTAALQAGKARATAMLQLAATLDVSPQSYGARVRVTNETGHKLWSGYPEGRRMWLHVIATDASDQVVYESGNYDPGTGVIDVDDDLKIYEIHAGLSPALAQSLGLAAGPSFHFVLNDTIYFDNRIPPRGFTNAAFAAVQAAPIGAAYPDGQYWDDTHYLLPAAAESVRVTLYYQTTSKEYVEFLRDENVTNSAGQNLYNAWVAAGRATPVAMADTTIPVSVSVTAAPDRGERGLVAALDCCVPNPFRDGSRIAFTASRPGLLRLQVFDILGRRVRTLVDEVRPAGRGEIAWDGRDDRGAALASGIYFVRFETGRERFSTRIVRVR